MESVSYDGLIQRAQLNSAITGLREQIIENAIILYPQVVKDYQVGVFHQNSMHPKDTEAFKIITKSDDRGVRAILMSGGGYLDCKEPHQVLAGPLMETRSEALEALLVTIERRR